MVGCSSSVANNLIWIFLSEFLCERVNLLGKNKEDNVEQLYFDFDRSECEG